MSVDETINPAVGGRVELPNGAYLEVPAGAYSAPVRVQLTEVQGLSAPGEVGPTVRLVLQPVTGSEAKRTTRPAQDQTLLFCVPSDAISLDQVDVLIRSDGVETYAWAERVTGECISIDLPAGHYEVEFVAVLVARGQNPICDEYALTGAAGNTPSRQSAIVLIHGWQKDKSSCMEFVGWEPTEEYWSALLQSVINCGSECATIKDNYNIYYFKYPSIVSPRDAAAELRVALNREAQSDPTLIEDHLVLVGYSMGGLVGRYFMQVNEFSRVQKLVTLGTPHRGTYDVLTRPDLLPRSVVQRAFGVVAGAQLPDTDGTRSLNWRSEFIGALDGRQGERRLDIHTLGGSLPSPVIQGGLEYVVTSEIIGLGIQNDEVEALGNQHDGIVPVSSASLEGTFREPVLIGYDHGELRSGNSPGMADPLWVRLREILGGLGEIADGVQGRLTYQGAGVPGWQAYIVAKPDTLYFLSRIIELPILVTTTDVDGRFEFSGLEIGQDYAVVLQNPRLQEAFSREELEYVHVDQLQLREREILQLQDFDTYYRNPTPNDNVLAFNYGMTNPGSLRFSWNGYHQTNVDYAIHVHDLESSLECWFSPRTAQTTLSFNLLCNGRFSMGSLIPPGKYYWYVIIFDRNEFAGRISGFSSSDFFTLVDSRGAVVPNAAEWEPERLRGSVVGPVSGPPAVAPR